jgi:hypothetical protein
LVEAEPGYPLPTPTYLQPSFLIFSGEYTLRNSAKTGSFMSVMKNTPENSTSLPRLGQATHSDKLVPKESPETLEILHPRLNLHFLSFKQHQNPL